MNNTGTKKINLTNLVSNYLNINHKETCNLYVIKWLSSDKTLELLKCWEHIYADRNQALSLTAPPANFEILDKWTKQQVVTAISLTYDDDIIADPVLAIDFASGLSPLVKLATLENYRDANSDLVSNLKRSFYNQFKLSN